MLTWLDFIVVQNSLRKIRGILIAVCCVKCDVCYRHFTEVCRDVVGIGPVMLMLYWLISFSLFKIQVLYLSA